MRPRTARLASLLVLVLTLTLGACSGARQEATQLTPLFQQSVPTTILFDFNQATLDPEARRILDAQAAFIRQYPTIWFSVEGHADRVGAPQYNQALGLKRANTALDYLVTQGVNPTQLEAIVSFGEDKPAVETEARERRNRRVVTSVGGTIDPTCNCRKRPGV